MYKMSFARSLKSRKNHVKKALLFGGTGNLGKEIAQCLGRSGYELTAVVRNPQKKAKELETITAQFITADVTDRNALNNICQGFDVVITALGKSVSPNDHSKPTFHDIDLVANSSILEEAKKSGVKKFVYISAFHAERYIHLEYFSVHHQFSEKLKQSGINYSIIKPPAIFSAFIDVIEMAKKGQLVHMGAGDKKTNPIYEGDLAAIAVGAIDRPNATIEAGGPEIYTRKQLNEIIQQEVNPGKKIMTVPLALVTFFLPMLKLVNKNMYDKFAFFIEVMQHDTIAPPVGTTKFESYIKARAIFDEKKS